jgi:hypothetical protein
MLGLTQHRVDVAHRAGLLPRPGHQLLLALLHHTRASRGSHPQPRIQVKLAQPARLPTSGRQRGGTGLQLPIDRCGQHILRRSREQALQRRLKRHPCLVRPRRRRVRAQNAQCALQAHDSARGCRGELRHATTGRAHVELRRPRRGGIQRTGMQPPGQRLKAALRRGGELPRVVHRQPQRGRRARAPRRV